MKQQRSKSNRKSMQIEREERMFEEILKESMLGDEMVREYGLLGGKQWMELSKEEKTKQLMVFIRNEENMGKNGKKCLEDMSGEEVRNVIQFLIKKNDLVYPLEWLSTLVTQCQIDTGLKQKITLYLEGNKMQNINSLLKLHGKLQMLA